jgi:ATP-dependent DNA helicase RecG
MQCGRFLGQGKAETFDHIDLHDHLPRAVESIILFLKKTPCTAPIFRKSGVKMSGVFPLGILREVEIRDGHENMHFFIITGRIYLLLHLH